MTRDPPPLRRGSGAPARRTAPRRCRARRLSPTAARSGFRLRRGMRRRKPAEPCAAQAAARGRRARAIRPVPLHSVPPGTRPRRGRLRGRRTDPARQPARKAWHGRSACRFRCAGTGPARTPRRPAECCPCAGGPPSPVASLPAHGRSRSSTRSPRRGRRPCASP